MNISKLLLVFAITLMFAANVQADTIRCGNETISDGQEENIPTMEEVLEKCGPPSHREENKLYYKDKNKRLDFDGEGKLMSINAIDF